ncbi:hypothetical protein G7067_04025 [Leucobacter insecticola]|uniref:Uncharacterized protein n=1 Tax=Leucobacter insecticola TaxID=2714934 RepID=A0A6G8FHD2_9MICO|nr:hypothetical protein [Leucobacter insecticola]QIM15771.1 hypothetical protein G7067_04025 [Leucobacter insecticola]
MPSASRQLRRILPLAVLGGLLLQASPALAADAPEVVQLSSDGVSYSRSLNALFGPVSLAPLTSTTDEFWVQNAGDEPAYLTIRVIDAEVPDPSLAAALTLSAGPASAAPEAFPLPETGSCVTLAAGTRLAPQEDVRIDSKLALGDLFGTQGQGASIRFTLQVVLSDQQFGQVGQRDCTALPGTDGTGGSGTGAGTGGPDIGAGSNAGNGGGRLETTGAELSSVFGFGAVFALAGVLILAYRRRRRDTTSDTHSGDMPVA